MSATATVTVADTKPTAAERYGELRAQIAVHLRDIKSGLVEHGKAFRNDSSQSWGSVSDLGRFECELKNIADTLMKRGEHEPR